MARYPRNVNVSSAPSQIKKWKMKESLKPSHGQVGQKEISATIARKIVHNNPKPEKSGVVVALYAQ